MKKKIIIGSCSIAFFVLLILNVISARSSGNNFLSLTSLLKAAFAECETGGPEQCPGGSCVFYWQGGSCCSACCQEGENPTCNVNGCKCE